MRVSPVKSFITFDSNPQTQKQKPKDSNPISKTGEKMKLAQATFIAGLGLGARLLFELMDGDFIVEDLGKTADKIVSKQHKGVTGNKKALLQVGAFAGLLAMFIGGFAILYTLFKSPKINYEGNVNAHKKGKDMDVYIKTNEVEKELYSQMNDKAKTATDEEKAKLQEQYMKMQMAKNRVPDFVKQL